MNNHWNADNGSTRLLEAVGYYICKEPDCDAVCDIMTVRLEAARKRLCVPCLHKSLK